MISKHFSYAPNALARTVPVAPEADTRSKSIKTLNTAIVASRAKASASASAGDINEVLRSPALDSILSSVKKLSLSRGISEQAAAMEIVIAFRKLDTFWTETLIQEGVAKLQAGN